MSHNAAMFIAYNGSIMVPLWGYRIVEGTKTNTVVSWALADESDADRVCGRRWHVAAGYAGSGSVRMHLLLCRDTRTTDERGRLVVDHINRDKLDNRSANLRRVTDGENARNQDFAATASRRGRPARCAEVPPDGIMSEADVLTFLADRVRACGSQREFANKHDISVSEVSRSVSKGKVGGLIVAALGLRKVVPREYEEIPCSESPNA